VISAPEVEKADKRKRTKSGEREIKKTKATKVVTKSAHSRKEYARNSNSHLREFEAVAGIDKNKENVQSNSSQLICKETKKIRDLTISSNSSQNRN
jgi:hypothetical protein